LASTSSLTRAAAVAKRIHSGRGNPYSLEKNSATPDWSRA
jgi:hypothetical protein